VAIMLVLLGVASLTGLTRRVTAGLTPARAADAPVHTHVHTHDDYVHDHPHGHDPGGHGHADQATPISRLDRLFGRMGTTRCAARWSGSCTAAGSAAVALLVLATIRDPPGPGYLLLFGAGRSGMI
jgi:high-affinity nickel-transport protein